MRYVRIKFVIGLFVMLGVAGLATASIPAIAALDDAPELPSPLCDKIQVQGGDSVVFHAYAVGVQVYRWNGSSWTFVEPIATLYADAGYQGKVGTHYVGPTWESNSGSKVVGARVDGCSPDPASIAWLLLRKVSSEGPGVFENVTFVQRVNTVGGLAPAAPGASIGAITQVPYTAEYFFYSAN